MLTGYFGFLNYQQQALIASGNQESSAISTGGFALCGIKFPATFTGTAVTFEMCDTVGGTYVPVYDASGPVSVTIAQARYYALDPKTFQGIAFLKIKSGTAEGADRTLICSLKGF